MSQTMTALAYWLHELGTVLLVGNYLLLSILYLPVLVKYQVEPSIGIILSDISKHSRLWMYASVFIFFLSGIYLMFANPNYLGIGDFRNIWSVMMLVKHILIVAMLGIGFWFNGILRVGPLMSSNTGANPAIARFRQYSNLMAGTGVLVLLLTAISQAQ